MGKVDTLFIKRKEKCLATIQIYVDGIIFGATNGSICEDFENEKEFQTSMIGELTYLLGFQRKQTNKDICNNQSKFANDILKNFYGLRQTLCYS